MERDRTIMPGRRIMLIGGYGMEIVECGGSLVKNARAGGVSHAVLAFVGEKMRDDLEKSAAILETTVEYLDLDTAEISASIPEKIKLVRAIRAFRPDIIITQDPEHCIADFDPGRRPLMMLILESIALAGRAFALEETAPHEPHSGATLYYMTPEKPNCIVDILPVWDAVRAAMDVLESQLTFSAHHYERIMSAREIHELVPNWDELPTYLEKGKEAKRQIDRATALFYGACGHSSLLLSEAYRKQELFELDNLMI